MSNECILSILKSIKRSAVNISPIIISHSLKFHKSGALAKKTASLIKKETFEARFGNRPLLGFAFRNNTGKM